MGKKMINRRQFMVKSAIGVCGLGAACGTCGIAFSSSRKPSAPASGAEAQRIEIPPYNADARFFKPHQYSLVAILAALIVPTDDEPGATEAGVVDFIDERIADSERKQTVYTKGLAGLDNFCKEKYGRAFMALPVSTQEEVLGSVYDARPAHNLLQRVARKLSLLWQDILGDRLDGRFLMQVRRDVIEGFYANPISWQQVGYYGPPNPVGYMDFDQAPTVSHYSTSIRLVDDVSCNTCHEVGEHPRGGLIDHTCTACHRPHEPWPYDESAFHLEDHVGVLFSSPDRRKGRTDD